MKRLLPLAALLAAPGLAAAFPANGTYYSACAPGGGPAEGALEATLTFPELCFEGACCALYNPTRLRGLDEEFLYDGNCEEDDSAFEARIFFGEGPDPEAMVVVLRGLGATLYPCAAETEAAAPAPEPAPDPTPEPSPDTSAPEEAEE